MKRGGAAAERGSPPIMRVSSASRSSPLTSRTFVGPNYFLMTRCWSPKSRDLGHASQQ